jgi:predicted MPP superfamily phosphohydrolase
MIELTEVELFLPQLPASLDNLCILHAGDLHSKRYGPREQKLYRVLQEGCDILIFSGDFCHQFRIGNPFSNDCGLNNPLPIGLTRYGLVFPAHAEKAIEVCTKILSGFRPSLGIYAIQGNHDPDDVMDGITQLGVKLLQNETVTIHSPAGIDFNLCGLRCYCRSSRDVPAALMGMNPNLFTIAVCHYPEMAESLTAAGTELVLAGHTHGGQICLPGRKPLLTHSQTGKQFVSGLTRFGKGYVFTTRGIGYSLLPLRICCPGEIARLRLHRGDYQQSNTRISRL